MKKATEGWIKFAHDDIYAAEALLKIDEGLHNIVLFHCQQCLEKILKAFLEHHGLRVPKTHSLERLINDLPPAVRSASNPDEEFLNLIDDIYISARYPGDLGLLPTGMPSREEAEVILIKTRLLFNNFLSIIENSTCDSGQLESK